MKREKQLCNIGHTVISVDGNRCRYERCIGFCNNKIHKAFVTKRILEKHECIKRKCTFLDIMEDHPYWQERNRRKDEKRRIKNTEKAILEETNKYIKSLNNIPETAKAVFCKHLFDSKYILLFINSPFIGGLSQYLHSNLGVHVYIRTISEDKVKNIEYTYINLLDEPTRAKTLLKKSKK